MDGSFITIDMLFCSGKEECFCADVLRDEFELGEKEIVNEMAGQTEESSKYG